MIKLEHIPFGLRRINDHYGGQPAHVKLVEGKTAVIKDKEWSVKKLGLFYSRNYIFHIKDDDGKAFDVDVYKLHPQQGETSKTHRRITYSTWVNIAPYSSAIELDRDSMQGLILGIFSEEI